MMSNMLLNMLSDIPVCTAAAGLAGAAGASGLASGFSSLASLASIAGAGLLSSVPAGFASGFALASLSAGFGSVAALEASGLGATGTGSAWLELEETPAPADALEALQQNRVISA